MSRIIRCKDTPKASVTAVGVEEKRTPAGGEANRAKGSVAWLSGREAQPGGHLSEFERRQIEANEIIARAKTESERIQRDAYHEGFRQGEAAGRKLAAQKIEPVLKSLIALIEAVSEERRTTIEKHETELIRIAFLVAVKILHREIEISSEAVLSVARAAMAKVIKAKEVLIRVSPYDLEMMQQQMNEADVRKDWLPENVKLEADFNIGRGGCKVITDSGEIDATIETEIHLLKSILWGA